MNNNFATTPSGDTIQNLQIPHGLSSFLVLGHDKKAIQTACQTTRASSVNNEFLEIVWSTYLGKLLQLLGLLLLVRLQTDFCSSSSSSHHPSAGILGVALTAIVVEWPDRLQID
jgi:hypothetical protein